MGGGEYTSKQSTGKGKPKGLGSYRQRGKMAEELFHGARNGLPGCGFKKERTRKKTLPGHWKKKRLGNVVHSTSHSFLEKSQGPEPPWGVGLNRDTAGNKKVGKQKVTGEELKQANPLGGRVHKPFSN